MFSARSSRGNRPRVLISRWAPVNGDPWALPAQHTTRYETGAQCDTSKLITCIYQNNKVQEFKGGKGLVSSSSRKDGLKNKLPLRT